jgi:hypothetical protein
MSIAINLKSIVPLKDTWQTRKFRDITWGMEPVFDFSSMSAQDVNSWFADSFVHVINISPEFIRVEKVNFVTDHMHSDGVEPVTLAWDYGVPQEVYTKEVVLSIQRYQAPIYELTVELGLLVYVRTQESPNKPVLGWVSNLASFDFHGGPEYGDPSLRLEINTTLFCSDAYDGRLLNEELHELNHPQLSAFLRGWERAFCSEIVPDAPLTSYKYGFLPESVDSSHN